MKRAVDFTKDKVSKCGWFAIKKVDNHYILFNYIEKREHYCDTLKDAKTLASLLKAATEQGNTMNNNYQKVI